MDWISGLATIGSGIASYLGAREASNAQQDAAQSATYAAGNATKASIASNERMFNKTADMSLPWRAIGEESINELYYEMTGQKATEEFNPAAAGPSGEVGAFNFETAPGYEWRMDQGIEAVNRGASAAGQLDSGARNKDLTRFGQGLASSEYANSYNRWENERNFAYNDRQNYLNRLASMSGLGQTAAAQTGQAASVAGSNQANAALNFGNTASNNALVGGAGQASGYINMANSAGNMLNNLAGLQKL